MKQLLFANGNLSERDETSAGKGFDRPFEKS